MTFCRIVVTFFSAWLSFQSFSADAQAPEPRLRGAIRDGSRAVLPGSKSPRIERAQDLGPVERGYPLRGMTLVFRRSDSQEAAMQALLTAQQDPGSAVFHRWLKPEEIGERFGMAAADLAATKNWLAAQGFQVRAVSHARDRITFAGTAAQAEQAFGTQIHRFRMGDEVHVAPIGELSLPGELAAVTSAVLHLSDFRPKPMARPALTAALDEGHYLTPSDLQVMYDMPHVADTNSTSGTGQAIAIVGQSFVNLNGSWRYNGFGDVTGRQQVFGVLVPNTGVEAISFGDEAETEIDLQYAGGVVPAASIFLVHTGSDPNTGVFDALAFAIDADIAPVISISYSECEFFLSQSEIQENNALFEQAAAQGQTLIAASGDAGSTACAMYTVSNSLSAVQQQALAVAFPASSPYVTAVGGTQMAAGTFGVGPSSYWSLATAGSDVSTSLLSYVPEVAWNEDSRDRLFAGGGGASTVYARPAWQSGIPGIPDGGARLLPDISLQASAESPGFLFCTDDISFLASEGQSIGCEFGLRGDNNQYTVGGGTSFAAPVFAGMTALLNQQLHTTGQGPLNATLYQLARDGATNAAVFHDIVSGTIACSPGSRFCSAPGQTGYAATAGFDQATGLGSVDFAKLLAAWPAGGAASLSGSLVQFTLYESYLNPGAVETIQIGVLPLQSAGGTQVTGSVSVSVDGVVADAAVPLTTYDPFSQTASGSFLFSAPATSGSHIVTATYAGDAQHGPATATTAIMVGKVLASGTVVLSATDVTVPANGYANSTITVTPLDGYNGVLTWSLTVTGGTGSGASGCYSIASLPVQGPATVTLSLGSGTACRSSLPAARSSMRSIKVTGRAAASTKWGGVSAAAGFLLCCLLPARRRRPSALLALLLSIGSLGLSGCGGSGGRANPGAATGGTVPSQAVTYTATLTGVDSVNSGIESTAAFHLTLQ